LFVWACVAQSLSDDDSRLFGWTVTEVEVTQQPIHFGEELRRRRLAADLTLTCLARMVHYSKGQLSKVERCLKPPSRELARLCDAALGADGALIALFQEKVFGTGVTVVVGEDEEVWLMQLSADSKNWLQLMSRRQMIAAGAASVPGMCIGKPAISAGVDDTTLLGIYRSLFDQYRQLGQIADSRLLLPVLIAQAHALRELSAGAGPRARQGLLILGSRYAEYVGWLIQETGNDHAALSWTHQAVDLAAEGGDHDLAAYGLVRHALVMLYREDARQTIELAQRAQDRAGSPRIRGLAAQREAQGYALAGNYDACMRSLDRAQSLLSCRLPDPDAPVLGTTNLADPAEMIRGWCLYDLGRPTAAAEVIGQQMAHVPPQALRARVRFGMRQALAHATAGEVDLACHLTAQLLDGAITLGSTTVTKDLRSLARALSRNPRNTSVRDLAPRLSTALQTAIA
jgi:transcriptional regulator with XRE-family HTH domain